MLNSIYNSGRWTKFRTRLYAPVCVGVSSKQATGCLVFVVTVNRTTIRKTYGHRALCPLVSVERLETIIDIPQALVVRLSRRYISA